MSFVKYFCFVAVAVLFVFASQSRANEIADMVANNAVAKYVLSQNFLDFQREKIAKGTDNGSIVARTALETITKAAEKCLADGGSPEAVQIARDGILNGIILVAAAASKANSIFDAGVSMAREDPEAAAADVKKRIKMITDLIYVAGVPIHHAQGAALYVAGNEARDNFENSITSIQHAGHSMFETLDTAESVFAKGMRAGVNAMKRAVEAARKVISTGAIAIYSHMINSANESFKGILVASKKGSGLTKLLSGATGSLTADILIDDPEALKALNELNTKVNSILSNVPKGLAAEAIKTVVEGFSTTIRRTANAFKVAKDALKEAAKLADHDIAAATALLKKGIEGAILDAIRASSDAYFALGAAGHMNGKAVTEKLVPAIFWYENGRVACFVDVGLAQSVLKIGLKAGQVAAKEALDAAFLIISASEDALYTHMSSAADIAFDVLKSL